MSLPRFSLKKESGPFLKEELAYSWLRMKGDVTIAIFEQ